MRKKLIYVVSDVDKVLPFEWASVHLCRDFDLQFILIGKQNTQLQMFLESRSVRCHIVADDVYGNHLRCWWRIFSVLQREKPEIVHAHLWRAYVLGLTAAWLLRIPKRIYTHHHATIHFREYPSGLKWDRLCNAMATDIVAPSENVKEILTEWELANPGKVTLIHNGFEFNYFEVVDQSRIHAMREKLSLSTSDSPVIGAIARYTKWKGVHYIIDAFAHIRKTNPRAILILANAHGDYAHAIGEKLKGLPKDSYREIAFEEDVAALYKVFDVFVHTPTDAYAEAFGQTYVEALVAGIPSVFTLSGVATEFVRHEWNALVVPFKNAFAIAEAISGILGNPDLAEKLESNGRQSVQKFPLDIFIRNLKRLYDQ